MIGVKTIIVSSLSLRESATNHVRVYLSAVRRHFGPRVVLHPFCRQSDALLLQRAKSGQNVPGISQLAFFEGGGGRFREE